MDYFSRLVLFIENHCARHLYWAAPVLVEEILKRFIVVAIQLSRHAERGDRDGSCAKVDFHQVAIYRLGLGFPYCTWTKPFPCRMESVVEAHCPFQPVQIQPPSAAWVRSH